LGKRRLQRGEKMKKTLLALIAGCALVAGTAGPALCADIVGTVLDANGRAVAGVNVSTSTQDGQGIGSAVTDGQGDYTINDVSSGLYYITLAPPAGSDLRGQSVASYVGGNGLTVNWGVAPGRAPVATAMPGVSNNNPGISAIASASKPVHPPPGCEVNGGTSRPPGPPCGPKKSKKREHDNDD
jgi:hypothetical protein